MRDLSLHVLDIAENSINASATLVEITIIEDTWLDRLTLRVEDNGVGIDLMKKTEDMHYTSKRGKRFGFGIPLLRQSAEECHGHLIIGRREGGGTTLRADFRLGHIDLKPMGDMGATMAVLVGGHPELDYVFRFRRDTYDFVLDTRELRKELDGLPLSVPQVLSYINQEVNDGIRRANG